MIMKATAALWRNADYLRFRTARAVSLLGSGLSWIAYPLLVLSLGGNAAEAGLVASCVLVTRAVCRLPGGQAADRFDRRALMLAADLVRLIAVGSIPLAALWHGLGYPQLLAVAVIEGVCSAFFDPAAAGLVRDLVPREQMTAALAQAQAVGAAADLLGPVLGGALFELSRLLPFTLDAASYGLSALLLLGLAARPAPAAGPASDRRVTAGLRWLAGQPGLMKVLILVGVINFVAAAASVAVVVTLRQGGTAPSAIGAVLTSVGVGGIVGSWLAPRIIARLSPLRLYLAVGAVWTAGLTSFAIAPTPWVVGPALGLMLVFAPAAGVMLGTMTLGEAPRDLLGRVSTAEQVATSSLATAGPLLGGVLLEVVGVAPMWLILAGCCLGASVLLGVPMRARRRPPAAAPSAAAERPAV
jgi:predicted MFS family arabinose efflux permease